MVEKVKALALLPMLVLATSLFAGQYAVTNTGSRIAVQNYTTDGSKVKLYLPGGGEVEVDASQIVRFEKDEYVPPPPAPAAEAQPSGPVTGAEKYDHIVRDSASRYGVDADLIHSVINTESDGDPRAVSSAGAAGLMQLMPATARTLNVHDRFDPAENIQGGTAYLRALLDHFDGNVQLALAAYNAGLQKVESYHRQVPPYRETQAYVRRVINSWNAKKLAQQASSKAVVNVTAVASKAQMTAETHTAAAMLGASQ